MYKFKMEERNEFILFIKILCKLWELTHHLRMSKNQNNVGDWKHENVAPKREREGIT